MSNFASVMKRLRIERGITQEQLAAMLKVSRSTIGMYETGSREPDFETSEAIADIFNVDMDYLMGRSDVERKHPITPSGVQVPPGFRPLPEMTQVPLIGNIACGTPITAEENIKQYIGVPAPRICDGDIVCIRKQCEVETGQIAAVRIGEEATLKHFYKSGDMVQLIAENSAVCPPMIFSGTQLADIKIEGLAVGFCRGLL